MSFPDGTSSELDGDGTSPWDPVFLNSRREAWVILGCWFVALLWALPCSYFMGYGKSVDPDAMETILGMPEWVFWGIAMPWLAADVFTAWFCFCYMANDDIGQAEDEMPAPSDEAAGTEVAL